MRYNVINRKATCLPTGRKDERLLPAKDIYDRSLKILAKQYPKPFIKLALGSAENINIETIENPEINLPEKRLDFVYGLTDEEKEYILHLDFQDRKSTRLNSSH